MTKLTAQDYIDQLQLLEHPEGGYFKEVYRAEGEIYDESLPEGCEDSRSYSTSIYFLLKTGQFSAFHKINQDEGWHFYAGDSLIIHMISPSGEYSYVTVGQDIFAAETFQYFVPAGYYFAAELADKDINPANQTSGYSLVGCTVAPGFDFADFVMPSKAELMVQFPQHKQIIEKLGFGG
ncbi:cupin domain-containing protein [Catenovulum sp. SM1970]|uniref:cupin domain-containing protein n=1 Tax=Marinifaba aquimaris TaxID=2741323 RepID=UPI0015743D55|nr:cupin domain-containing protein [Marinifaba aquimaris]NTS75428.1 cupin domain-containing protein [Marinifaba aquimaris]